MRFQVTIDTLLTSAALLALVVALLSAFYNIYITAEEGIRRGHLTYLSRVIEDRMKTCDVVDGAKIYSPYEVNIFCDRGEVCWRSICVETSCVGGGRGKRFVVENCTIKPLG